MRLFSLLAIGSVLSAPAFAADLGTYRPGAPYHSVVAPGADVCDSHCAGDAQCKGWNYVKVNPRAPGVCEFNSKDAAPIESAISISGQGSLSFAPNLTQGNTNTIRVGTSVAPVQTPQRVVTQVSPTRRVVREAVPQQIQTRQTVARVPTQTGSLTEQQNRYRQATGHVPQQLPQQIAPQNYQQQAARQQAAVSQPRLLRDPRIVQPPQPQQRDPRFQHNLEGSFPVLAQPRQQTQPATPQDTSGRPPIGVPITGAAQSGPQANAQPSAIPRGSVNSPVTNENAQARLQAAQIEAQQRAYAEQLAAAQKQAQAISFEQAKQSLFGSLNDDVAAPNTLTNLPQNPDAPIATMQARPVVPVDRSELAGPPRR